MELFDIQAIMIEHLQKKKEYHDIIILYEQVKANGKTLPDVERQIAELENTIQQQSIMISNYENLNMTLRNLDYKKEDSTQKRNVRAKYD